MTNKRNGFTLIEATITVAVASILATIAVPQYNIYVAKTQLAESIVLMDSAKPTTIATVVKNGLCTIDGKDQVITGKYGSLVVSGTVNQTAVKNSKVRMATGCVFTYTLNTTGVSKLIAGKTVVADLFNNGTFSKNSATTADLKFVPKALSLLDQDSAGGKLTPVVPGGPDITNPDDNGGPSTPITPPDPTNPIDPTNPPDPTNPTDPTLPTTPPVAPPETVDPTDPSGETVADTMMTLVYRHTNLPPSSIFDFDPQDSGQMVSAYMENSIYVHKGNNSSHQIIGGRGSIKNNDFKLENWSFHMNAWYSYRDNFWDYSAGWVTWTGSPPSLQLTTTAGTAPKTFYVKYGDIKYTFTRQKDVVGKMVYQDTSKEYDNGVKYRDISTPLSFSLSPFK